MSSWQSGQVGSFVRSNIVMNFFRRIQSNSNLLHQSFATDSTCNLMYVSSCGIKVSKTANSAWSLEWYLLMPRPQRQRPCPFPWYDILKPSNGTREIKMAMHCNRKTYRTPSNLQGMCLWGGPKWGVQYPSPPCRLAWAVTHVIVLNVKLTILREYDVALMTIVGILISNIIFTVDTRAH